MCVDASAQLYLTVSFSRRSSGGKKKANISLKNIWRLRESLDRQEPCGVDSFISLLGDIHLLELASLSASNSLHKGGGKDD